MSGSLPGMRSTYLAVCAQRSGVGCRQREEVPSMELHQHGAQHPAADLIGDVGVLRLPLLLLGGDLHEVAAVP